MAVSLTVRRSAKAAAWSPPTGQRNTNGVHSAVGRCGHPTDKGPSFKALQSTDVCGTPEVERAGEEPGDAPRYLQMLPNINCHDSVIYYIKEGVRHRIQYYSVSPLLLLSDFVFSHGLSVHTYANGITHMHIFSFINTFK